jgi:hypothetical protein
MGNLVSSHSKGAGAPTDSLPVPHLTHSLTHTLTHINVRTHGVYSVSQKTDFGVSPPARSADALSATLYGHSAWRLLSRAER